MDGVDRIAPKENTMVILTADHGECFEDGIVFEHSICMSDAAIRVPLIIRHPSFTPGARTTTQVSLLDVAPTVLDVAGLKNPKSFAGRSLRGIPDLKNRYAFFQYPRLGTTFANLQSKIWGAIRTVAGEPVRGFSPDTRTVGIAGRTWRFLKDTKQRDVYKITIDVEIDSGRTRCRKG